jgi:cytochrome c biogenesis protein CcdA
MIELLLSFVPFLIVDVLNPVLFALLVVAVGSDRPIANSTAFLAGHTIAYFGSGIIIALGLEYIADRLSNPLPIDFILELLVGLLCIWAATKAGGGNASENKNPDGELRPIFCFGYGAVINFIAVPFALPYFAVVGQVLKAELSVELSLLVLAVYNLAYAFPFLLIPLAVLLIGDSCKPALQKISNVLVSVADKLMPLLLLLLGLALSADAISFLTSGEGLW